MKHISICSDDFGLSNGINSGIIDCVKNDRITEVSCITILELFNDDFFQLANYNKKINIGLHLVLTDLYYYENEKKVFLPSYQKFLKDILLNELNKYQIKKCINLQIDNFFKFFKIMPNFIDGHKHIQQFPFVFEILREVMIDRGIKNDIWLRNTKNINFKKDIKNFFSLKRIMINYFGNKFKKFLILNKFKTNYNFLGIYDFNSKKSYRSIFLSFLKNLSHSNLIACHPGYVDYSIKGFDSLIEKRYDELNYLLSDEFKIDLRKNNIILKRYEC